MAGDSATAIIALNAYYLATFPIDAAKQIEGMSSDAAAEILAAYDVGTIRSLWDLLAPDVAASIGERLDDEKLRNLLLQMNPNDVLSILGQCGETERKRILSFFDDRFRKELEELATYPDESAGRLMETRINVFRPEMTVAQTLERLRESRLRGLHSIFLVDDQNVLSGRVDVHDIATAELAQSLRELTKPISASVNPVTPRDEVVELLERYKLPNIPVVSLDGKLLGVVRYSTLVQALEQVASASIQTMVGASKDERALSKASFAVRKRLPWLQINLLTAFLAAAVVGIFEDTIAQFTALAVLLPVVAGQSGNAGAQALAVTMRGLALREITVRQWLPVTSKEVIVGLANGIAVALTCGIGVYVWSGS
ncbi:MAG: CBS domain-containing protein, partial [Kiloniellales bacterium]|nr:CBS domain-containing protein [Kiloniellales bacterium]